jgi:FkbM family methyltransferase
VSYCTGKPVAKMLPWLGWKLSHITMPKGRLRIRHTSINGCEMVVAANEDVGRQIYYLRRYEASETAFIASALRPTDVCLDVGANVGYYTLLMARVASEGKVHAFEPDPVNHGLLSVNVALNRLSNVVLNQVALGSEPGESTFVVADDRAFSSFKDTGRQVVREVTSVPVTSVDEYVVRGGIPRVDVMKVDVEGAEGVVVEGAASLLGDASRRPRLLMLELYSANHRVFGESIDGIVERLERSGYEPFVIENGRRTPFGTKHHDRYVNVFFVPNSRVP